MGKISGFVKKHKVAIVSGTVAVLSFIGGVVVHSIVGKSADKEEVKMDETHPLFIQPDFYETFDEAVVAFKEMQKKTKHAVLFDSYGTDYGVY